MLTNKELKKVIKKSLGPDEEDALQIDEAYVAQLKKFSLPTEMLRAKNKASHKALYDNYVKTFNAISAELDAVDREQASLNHSAYRSLKLDETHSMNAVYLHELYFSNISDVNSEVAMDSLAFMRLERDFGSFDDWQRDFIACALSAKNGWAVTGYSTFLQSYVNFVIDLHDTHVPVGIYPVIVMDVWEHAYYRDYLTKRKTYVYAMMKEFDWVVIEERFVKADKIANVLK